MSPRFESFTVTMPADATLNSNRRLDAHRRVRPVKTHEIRAAFKAAAIGAGPIPAPVEVTVRLAFGRRARRDSPNWYPTTKAAIDGLVEAGVLSDDSDAHIRCTHIRAHDVDPTLRADRATGTPAMARICIEIQEVT